MKIRVLFLLLAVIMLLGLIAQMRAPRIVLAQGGGPVPKCQPNDPLCHPSPIDGPQVPKAPPKSK